MPLTSVAMLVAFAVLAIFAYVLHRRSAAIDPNDPPTPAEAEDARRFARLLVSEIKLFNEEKVREGQIHRDLHSRLRSEIDRARERFDERVRPVVVAERDYFADALVDILADGDAGALDDGDGRGSTMVH